MNEMVRTLHLSGLTENQIQDVLSESAERAERIRTSLAKVPEITGLRVIDKGHKYIIEMDVNNNIKELDIANAMKKNGNGRPYMISPAKSTDNTKKRFYVYMNYQDYGSRLRNRRGLGALLF